MAKHVSVKLDEEDFEYATELKDYFGLTWEEYMIEAADSLDEQRHNGRVA